MLASLNYAKPLQVDLELAQLAQLLACEAVRSYLEIGARYGGSFETIMRSLPAGSRGVAVDFPGGNFGDDESAPILLAAIDRLRVSGYQTSAIFGPSAAPEVVARVYAAAGHTAPPLYDAVMIDADHSYDAVAADFANYAPMARIVILHDIAAPPDLRSRTGRPVEVPRFWRQIKKSCRYTEIVVPGSLMGIGVLWRDQTECKTIS